MNGRLITAFALNSIRRFPIRFRIRLLGQNAICWQRLALNDSIFFAAEKIMRASENIFIQSCLRTTLSV